MPAANLFTPAASCWAPAAPTWIRSVSSYSRLGRRRGACHQLVRTINMVLAFAATARGDDTGRGRPAPRREKSVISRGATRAPATNWCSSPKNQFWHALLIMCLVICDMRHVLELTILSGFRKPNDTCFYTAIWRIQILTIFGFLPGYFGFRGAATWRRLLSSSTSSSAGIGIVGFQHTENWSDEAIRKTINFLKIGFRLSVFQRGGPLTG